MNDLKFAVRQLLKNPGFTAVTVLTLALGIGATTAIFSLINATLLRELPYPKPDQLAVIWAQNPSLKLGVKQLPAANADIAAWREGTQSFARLAAFGPGSVDIAEGGDPERVGAASVTAGFFETLGVTPLQGRTVMPAEDTFGAQPVVLISSGLWKRRFGGDPALVGKAISINGERRTVIGILPPEFEFPRGAEWPAYFPFSGRTEVWLPLAMRDKDDGSGWSNWQSREERGMAGVGRLKSAVTLRRAQAEMNVFASREANDHPDSHKGWSLKVIPLKEQVAGGIRPVLLILFGAVGLLLLIACVNVANVLLVRGVARQQEMAVRVALGAERVRLLRQLFTESLLLVVIGSGLGLLIAQSCLKTFLALHPSGPSRLDDASLDLPVLAFTVLAALVTSVVFGLVPLLQFSRFDLRKAIYADSRGWGSTVRQGARGWLVAIEVALALVLLTTAGLLVRSFLRVQRVQPGFSSSSVLAFDLQLPATRYQNDAPVRFYQQLTARLEALPGVRAAGAISYLPLSGGENMGKFVVEGVSPSSRRDEVPNAERRWVTPGYFAALGIPIRQGRVFVWADDMEHPKTVVINETLARAFFSKGDAIGHRVQVNGAWRSVVGVVSDVKSAALESDVRPQVYIPFAQDPWPPMTAVLHTDGNSLALASAVRGELKRLDALLPASRMRTMEQVVSKATSSRRFNMSILVFFAGSALLLTVMGIYGVVAFLVGRRVREIGIRVALGAQRRDVLNLILRQGMSPVACGSAVGLAGSLAGSRLIVNQLYGVSPSDPSTFLIIIALLFSAALFACWVPARRAARMDPMEALRTE